MTYISDRELEFHRRPFRAGFAEPAEPEQDELEDRKSELETQIERNNEQAD